MKPRGQPRLVFDESVEQRDKDEMTDRGCFHAVVVEGDDGRRYPVYFVDPVRLQQDIQRIKLTSGEEWFAEPGLIVLDAVTEESIERAVKALWAEGFFDHLKPLE